jgi:hypothetical protein
VPAVTHVCSVGMTSRFARGLDDRVQTA